MKNALWIVLPIHVGHRKSDNQTYRRSDQYTNYPGSSIHHGRHASFMHGPLEDTELLPHSEQIQLFPASVI